MYVVPAPIGCVTKAVGNISGSNSTLSFPTGLLLTIKVMALFWPLSLNKANLILLLVLP